MTTSDEVIENRQFAKLSELLPPINPMYWALAFFLVSLTITGFFWYDAQHKNDLEISAKFDIQVSQITTSLERQLADHDLILSGFNGFFKASDNVSRKDFHDYFDAMHFAENDAGFAAVAYHQIVPATDLNQHLTSVRREGFSSYQIQPAGKREVYAPMVYIEPLSGDNLKVLGFDPLTVEAERVAIERARDTDTVTISNKLILAQDAGGNIPGFVMYAPLYRRGAPHNSEATRRANFVGWVDAPFRMSALINHVFPAGINDIDFEIFDGHTISNENLLYDSNGKLSGDKESTSLHTIRQLIFGGHAWTLTFHAQPAFAARGLSQKPEFIATSGFLLSLLLSLIISYTINAQRRRLKLAMRRAEETKNEAFEIERQKAEIALRDSEFRWKFAIEAAGDGLWDWNIATNGLFVSTRWKEIYGVAYSGETDELNLWEKRLHPDDKPEVFAILQDYLAGKRKQFICEYRARCDDGTYKWILDRGVIVSRAPDGKPLRMIGANHDITERKSAEVALHEAQHIAQLGSWSLEMKTGKLTWSEEVFHLFEMDETQAPASYEAFLNAIHPDDRDEVNRTYNESLINRSSYEITHRLLMADGRIKWVQERCQTDFDDVGTPVRSRGTVQDITERKLVEIKLRENERDLNESERIGHFGSYVTDIKTGLWQGSPNIDVVFGIDDTFEKNIPNWNTLIVPEFRQPLLDYYYQVIQGDGKFNHQYQIIRPSDGALRWINALGEFTYDEEGNPAQLKGSVQDITEQKIAELELEKYRDRLETMVVEQTASLQETLDALKISEEKYRILLDESSDPIFAFYEDGRYRYVNQVFADNFGMKPEEMIGKTLWDIFPRAEADKRFAVVSEVFASGEITVLEASIPRADDILNLMTTAKPIFDEQHKVISVICVSKDITEMKKAEASALEAAHYARSLLEASLDPMVTISPEGKITDANKATENVMGLHRDFLIGADFVNLFTEPEKAREGYQHVFSQGFVTDYPLSIRHTAGKITEVLFNASVYRNQGGEVAGIFAAARDVSALKRSEKAALAASQAKSEFLANMSHEIRTPMNGVIGMVDVLQQTPLTATQHRMLSTVHESSLALLHILNDILDYSKIEAGKLAIENVPTPLREVVEGVAQLMTTVAYAKKIDIFVFVSPELPIWINSDPTRLRQILLNLLGNAVKFTRSEEARSGRVMLRVEPCELNDARAGVQLRFIDNGIGMNDEAIANLFQPFTQADESTARKFGGTGLGLSITQRLVEMLGGQISVKSALYQGSEFIVELPLQETEAGRALPEEPSLHGVQLVAVLQDEMTIEIVTTYGAAAGANVTVLADIESARRHLEHSSADQPTVVLLGLEVTLATSELALPKHVGVARLVKRGSSAPANEIVVPARPMTLHEFLHGVALASGHITAADVAKRNERRRPPPRSKAPTVAEAARAGRLILLAEDNETNREVIVEQLQLLGYAAETAEDGIAAFDSWRTGRYALLLTDCHMPNMDGFELTAAIRACETADARIPIIAVTANAMQGEAQRCKEMGMDDYLSKPLRLSELGPMLAKWLPKIASVEETPAIFAEALPPEPENSASPILDTGTLNRMVGDNPAMHRRLLEKFLPNAASQVEEILRATEQGEIELVAEVAHKLKSAARTVGTLQLGDLCQELEVAGRAGEMSACSKLVERLEAIFKAAEAAINQQLES